MKGRGLRERRSEGASHRELALLPLALDDRSLRFNRVKPPSAVADHLPRAGGEGELIEAEDRRALASTGMNDSHQ